MLQKIALKIHQNTTNYCFVYLLSVSIRSSLVLIKLSDSDRDRNVNKVRLVVFWWTFNMKRSPTKWICLLML